tara:strand:- start:222 stop:386 length:165 start_codon:yes stop_codon:yes gene_type:complete
MTGFSNTGGGGNFPSGWNPSFLGQPGTLICMMHLVNMLNSIARQANTPIGVNAM